MAEYRIVSDKYLGYEVQYRTLFWPLWRQCNFSNTHPSVERARAFAYKHASRNVVENLGRLP
jgi:hypothetical protein